MSPLLGEGAVESRVDGDFLSIPVQNTSVFFLADFFSCPLLVLMLRTGILTSSSIQSGGFGRAFWIVLEREKRVAAADQRLRYVWIVEGVGSRGWGGLILDKRAARWGSSGFWVG